MTKKMTLADLFTEQVPEDLRYLYDELHLGSREAPHEAARFGVLVSVVQGMYCYYRKDWKQERRQMLLVARNPAQFIQKYDDRVQIWIKALQKEDFRWSWRRVKVLRAVYESALADLVGWFARNERTSYLDAEMRAASMRAWQWVQQLSRADLPELPKKSDEDSEVASEASDVSRDGVDEHNGHNGHSGSNGAGNALNA